MISSRQELASYALRQLGGGIVNIELTPDQIEDAVEDAVQYFNDYHYEGIERNYIKFQIAPTKITVADATGFVENQTVTTSQGYSATIVSVDGNIISATQSSTGTICASGQTLTNGTQSSVISTVSKGTVDKGYIELPDEVFSVTRVLNTNGLLNHPDILFNVQYQIMANEIRNITSGQANYLYSTFNYLGHLDFILRKEKTYRFNRRMNNLYYDSSWDLNVGTWYVFECYIGLDPEVYSEVYNDPWLKKYTTAKMKRTWGQVLSKYSGMSLPGGVQYDGKYILEQAMTELKALEDEAAGNGAPLGFLVG
jgi:hypothetical protein